MPAHIESIAVEHGVEVFSSSQSMTDSNTPDCEPIFKKRKLSSILANGEDHVDNANDMDTDTNAPFVFTSDPSRIPDLDQFSSGPSSAATSEYSDSEDEHETDISSLVATANGEVDAEMAVPATAAAASVKKPEFDMNAQFRVKRLSDRARVPTRGSARAAGYDLYSAEKKIIPARGKALVDTQLSIAVPEGTYGRVAPRSGLASKFFIDTGAGVVDADYRGTLFVLLFNHSDKDFEIQEGDRVAQLILERIMTPDVLEVDDLEATDRGAGGFGSTGGHGLLKTQ